MNTNELLTVSTGNKKLVANAETKFLIWSLPAEKTCPFATDLCKKHCYAKKAERLYPQARAARERNFIASQANSFISDMARTIEYYISKKSWQGKKVIFRIHESGDFYNAKYVRKWVIISRMFPDVTFIAYTKSLAFFANELLPTNFVLRFSIWADTAPKAIELAENNDYPIYTAIAKQDKDNYKGIVCGCADCATCKACFTNDNKKIACVIH